ncbi:GPR153 [Branchiostoma lanceolatum]|uniref:GPR153 protein n=1 Tax=Branchiostoma lanceolatum TaxID=7740 RepID=A0A8J9YK25_BRALA|nr:GPR153 [Branchiostoma lanceolatum]
MAVEGVTLYLSIGWLCCVVVTVIGNLWCLAAVLRHWACLRPADVLVLNITLGNLTTALFPVLMYVVVTIREQTWPEPLCKVFVWSLLSFKMIVSLSVMVYTVTRLCDRSRSRPHSHGVSGECAKAVSLTACLLPMIVCVLPVVGIVVPVMSASNTNFYTNGQCAFSLAATGLEYAVFYMCALFVLLCVGIAAVELIFIRTRKAKDSTRGTSESQSTPEIPESGVNSPSDQTAMERVLDADRTARQWDFAAVGVTIVCYFLADVPFLVTNLLDVILERTPTWLPPTLVSTCLVQTAVAPWVFLTVCDRYRPRFCHCCRKVTAKEQQLEEISTASRSRGNTKPKASDHTDIPRPHSRVTWAQDGEASDDSTTSEEDVSARGRSTLPTVDEEDERPADPAATLARVLLSAQRPERSSEEDMEEDVEDVKPNASRRHGRKQKVVSSQGTKKTPSGDIWISGLTDDIVSGKLNNSSQPIPTPVRAHQARDISKRGEPDGLPPSQLFDGNSANTSAVIGNRMAQPPVPQKRKHSRPPPLYSDPPRLETTTDGKGFRPYKKDQPWTRNRHSGPPPPYSVALSKLNQNREPHNRLPRSKIHSNKTSSSSLEIIGQSGHVSDSDTDSSKDPVVPKVRFTHPLALENRAFVASPEEITQLYSPDEEVNDDSELMTPNGTPTSSHRGFIALKSLDSRLASQYSVTDQGEMVWHTADKKPITPSHVGTRPESAPTSFGDVIPVVRTTSPGRQVVLLSPLEASWV